MSPRLAPESDEPYWATACFSSAICIALIEKFGFLERSKPITIASNFWPTWKRSGRCFLQVQSLAHFFARLEIGHALGGDIDGIAGARIAPLASVALPGREGAEAAKLHPAASLKLLNDRIEKCAHHALDLLDGKIGMVVAKLLHELGTDQGWSPLLLGLGDTKLQPAACPHSR